MGYDLIPFSSKEDAAKFAAENEGKWIVQLHEVARSVEDQQETKKPDIMEQNAPAKKPLPRPRQLQYPNHVDTRPSLGCPGVSTELKVGFKSRKGK